MLYSNPSSLFSPNIKKGRVLKVAAALNKFMIYVLAVWFGLKGEGVYA